MKKLKWYQYLAIIISVVALWFIIVGIIGQNGVLIFVGVALIITSVQSFRSKEKPKNKKVTKA